MKLCTATAVQYKKKQITRPTNQNRAGQELFRAVFCAFVFMGALNAVAHATVLEASGAEQTPKATETQAAGELNSGVDDFVQQIEQSHADDASQNAAQAQTRHSSQTHDAIENSADLVANASDVSKETAQSSEKIQNTEKIKVKQVLEKVLASEAYGKKETKTSWQPKEKNKVMEQGSTDNTDWVVRFGNFLATAFEWVFWLVLATLVIYLLSRYTEWSQWFGGLKRAGFAKKGAKPTELFGLDVTEDSLPDDVLGRIKAHLNQRDYRKAVALMYRASLVRLIHDHALEIPKAATEGQCLRRVKKSRPRSEADAFASITQVWLRVAYADETPSQTKLNDALAGFERYYLYAAEATSSEAIRQAG